MVNDVQRWMRSRASTAVTRDNVRIEAGSGDRLRAAELTKELSSCEKTSASSPLPLLPVVAAAATSAFAPTVDESIRYWVALNQHGWAPKGRHEFARIANEFRDWLATKGVVSLDHVQPTPRDGEPLIAVLRKSSNSARMQS